MHVLEDRSSRFSGDVLKVLKSQDLEYVKTMRQTTRKKVEKLQNELAFIVGGNDQDDEEAKAKHTIFVDSARQVEKFSPASHFRTLPSLVTRTHNRPRIRQLLQPLATPTASSITAEQPQTTTSGGPVRRTRRRQQKASLEKYRELEARLQREQALQKAERELQVQKLLATQKGRRQKVGTDVQGNAVYKWRQERQK